MDHGLRGRHALALLWALANRLVSLPQVDWTPWINAPLAGTTMALAAFAVGRSIVRPVARAAHRSKRRVRLAMLAVGTPLTAWAGLTWISLEWNAVGAAVAALLPAWFAIGLFRPNLLPAWYPLDRPRIGLALVVVIVISLAGLSGTGGMPSGAQPDEMGQPIDPATEFGAIAPFPQWETAPFEEIPVDAEPMYGQGVGPITWQSAWRVRAPSELDGWATVQVEVWATDIDAGQQITPIARGVRLATAPLVQRGTRGSADLVVTPVPDRDAYYVAVVGTAADGRRELLGWPAFRQWTWRGTPWDYFAAQLRD